MLLGFLAVLGLGLGRTLWGLERVYGDSEDYRNYGVPFVLGFQGLGLYTVVGV